MSKSEPMQTVLDGLLWELIKLKFERGRWEDYTPYVPEDPNEKRTLEDRFEEYEALCRDVGSRLDARLKEWAKKIRWCGHFLRDGEWYNLDPKIQYRVLEEAHDVMLTLKFENYEFSIKLCQHGHRLWVVK